MMKRSLLQQLSLAMLGALLAAGCATGSPNAGGGGGGAQGESAASTTGDADACAIALGNVDANLGTTGVGAQPEPTANGLLLGNVALVALPTADDMPITGTTTGAGGGGLQTTAPGNGSKGTATTGAAGAAAGTTSETGGPAGTAVTPGTGGTTGGSTAPGTTGAAGTGAVGPTGTAGGGGTTGADRAGGTSAEVTAPNGTMAGPAPGGGGGINPTALDRIRTACPKITQILVVTETADRARLAQISMSVRKGQPVTAYLDEVSAMTKKASNVGGGAGSTFQPGESPTQTMTYPTPAGGVQPTVPPGAPVLTTPPAGTPTGAGGGGPAPGTFGTPPGQTGNGVVPPPNR